MKTRVLIIEDSDTKSFTTKQVLESQFKIRVNMVGANSNPELASVTRSYDPDMIIYRPLGGVLELLTKMKKRNTNCRNTEITMLVTQELDEVVSRKVQEFVENYPKTRVGEKAA